MTEDKIFLDIRQDVSTEKQKDCSIVSAYYDPSIKALDKYGNERSFADFYCDNWRTTSIDQDYKRLRIKSIILDVILIFVTVGVEFIKNFVKFEFLGNQPNFLKYIAIEISILLLYVNFSNALIKNMTFKKLKMFERQTVLNNMMSNKSKEYVKNDIAINDTYEIVKKSEYHYFGEDKEFGRKYLSNTLWHLNKKKNLDHTYNPVRSYQNNLNKVEGRHSVLLSVFSLVAGLIAQVFQIIDSWELMGSFHTKIIVSAIALPFVVWFVLYSFIKSKYSELWFDMEADYLIFNYQFLKMPFTSSSIFSEFKLPEALKDEVIKELTIESFVKAINGTNSLYFVTYRSFEFIKDDVIRIYGMNEYDSKNIIGDFNIFYSNNKPKIGRASNDK